MVLEIAADCRVGKTSSLIVKIDDQFSDNHPIGESNYSSVRFQSDIRNQARYKTPVNRADVTHHVPNLLSTCIDDDVFEYGCHNANAVSEAEEAGDEGWTRPLSKQGRKKLNVELIDCVFTTFKSSSKKSSTNEGLLANCGGPCLTALENKLCENHQDAVVREES